MLGCCAEGACTIGCSADCLAGWLVIGCCGEAAGTGYDGTGAAADGAAGYTEGYDCCTGYDVGDVGGDAYDCCTGYEAGGAGDAYEGSTGYDDGATGAEYGDHEDPCCPGITDAEGVAAASVAAMRAAAAASRSRVSRRVRGRSGRNGD